MIYDLDGLITIITITIITITDMVYIFMGGHHPHGSP